jgi:hypothetical protein
MRLNRLTRPGRPPAPARSCGHHWHVIEAGWRCCCCPARRKARHAPPAPGTGACADPEVGGGWEAELPAPRALASA